MPTKPLLLLSGLILSLAQTASAHHTFSPDYDINKTVSVAGKIAKVEWANPHVYLYVDVREANGKLVQWSFDLGPPQILERNGWDKNMVKAGDDISVRGWGPRDPVTHRGGAQEVALHGKTLQTRLVPGLR